jgi:hypothetical protein
MAFFRAFLSYDPKYQAKKPITKSSAPPPKDTPIMILGFEEFVGAIVDSDGCDDAGVGVGFGDEGLGSELVLVEVIASSRVIDSVESLSGV